MSHAPYPELLDAARAGAVSLELLSRLAIASSKASAEVLNEVALYTAREYLAGRVPFEEADVVMNAVFSVSATEQFFAENDGTIPGAMYEVYRAFDEGEYSHPGDGESVVPELKYTRPLIERLLASGESGA